LERREVGHWREANDDSFVCGKMFAAVQLVLNALNRIQENPMRERFGWNDLQPVQTVVDDARYRAEHRHDILMPSVADMGLRFADPNPAQPKGGYVAKIEGKDFLLTEGAVKTACRLMKTKPAFLKQFSDPMAFPQMLRNAIDNPGRSGPKGVLVRTNGLEVAAVLSPDYQIRDAHTQVADFAAMCEDNFGPVRGINAIQSGHGDVLSYRMVVGNNIMKKLSDLEGQFQMFVLSMSETGQIPDKTTLGLYRLVCTNGAMMLDRSQLVSEWNHHSPLEPYLNDTGTTIRHAGYMGQQWTAIFDELLSARMAAPASDVLHALEEERLITKGHFDAAERQVVGQEIESQFDFFNLLTQSAQELPTIQARQQAESTALRLFTGAGGVMQRLQEASNGHRGDPETDVEAN
jgi:hypothetical protein